VLDSNDVVCSVPPIINGEHSKISINTRNVLIEVTALNRPKAFICLNNIIWSFSEYCQVPFQVEPVEIINGEERFLTPNVSAREFTVSHKNAENLIGGKLLPEQVIGYLKRTGLTATVAS
jgi:phenylalanyl-tRNA synthetase beta chain